MSKISEEQWVEIRRIYDRWTYEEQTTQYDDLDIAETAKIVLQKIGLDAPVYVVSSPHEARAKAVEISGDPGMTLNSWSNVFLTAWCAYFEAAKYLGVKFDQEKYDLFFRVNRHITAWLWCKNAVYVMRRPRTIHWQNGLLHNESGPAVEFSDDFALWSINGIALDEQIVMRPETQTIEQIHAERNGDVRSIRIDRFGWVRYIEESQAKLLDQRPNEIEGTREALYKLPDGTCRLVATCPSGNGRIVSMGVPGRIETCEEAQSWLAGDEPFRILART